ncbi:MAG: hypothetical protein Q9M10_01475 [Mariprofundaceae bacterium]|nr:hypothetical protein [Mariprofundaceae bacterium]
MPLDMPKTQHYDRIGLWMLVVVIIITAAVFFWTRGHFQHADTSLNTHMDAQGHLQVLGISLGETTLTEAEYILKSKSDVALYIYPQGNLKAGRKLEAFFPAIADHTKIILLLKLPVKDLDQIEARASIPHLYPNQVARMNLAAKDRSALNHAVIDALTLIPNLTLTADNIKARFGKPDSLQHMENYDVYQYKKIGLSVQLHQDEPSSLYFSNF